MIAWLWKLIVGDFYVCRHKWKTVCTVDVFDSSVSRQRPVATDKQMRCEHCGDWRKRRL